MEDGVGANDLVAVLGRVPDGSELDGGQKAVRPVDRDPVLHSRVRRVDLDQILQVRVEPVKRRPRPVTNAHAVWPAIEAPGFPVAGSKLTSEFAGTAADTRWADVPVVD